MTFLIDLAIRPSIVLGAGLLLSACLSRRSASLRHHVLAASMLAAIAIAPVGLMLPRWYVTVPAVRSNAPPVPVSSAPAAAASIETPARDPSPASSFPSPLIAVWLAGVLVAVALPIAGRVRLARIAARASRIEDPRWLEILATVARRYGLTRRIQVARTDAADLIGTWGVLRPQVLLPRGARDWTLERVHVVFCHELAHVRRHDWLVQSAAELVRAVLWFNPLAWVACARLRRESEQACDDDVLAGGVGGREYATHLLDLARQCRRPGLPWASALPMAHPSTLERRIAAMLNTELDRRAPSRRAMAVIAVVLLLVLLPTAALRARQAGPAPLAGTIYDVTGGVLPGVEVTLVDAIGVTHVVTSNAAGRFEFPSVAPGTYVLEARLIGFRTLRHELELREARDWKRAVTLQVGELMETVSVAATRVADSGRAAPSSAPAAPVRVGGSIRPPLKIKDVRPIYPPSMREAGLTGVVPLEAIIGRDGSVSHVRVLSAQVHPDFAIAAVDAVRQWQFTPTLLNGVAVEVMMTVTVDFTLEE